MPPCLLTGGPTQLEFLVDAQQIELNVPDDHRNKFSIESRLSLFPVSRKDFATMTVPEYSTCGGWSVQCGNLPDVYNLYISFGEKLDHGGTHLDLRINVNQPLDLLKFQELMCQEFGIAFA